MNNIPFLRDTLSFGLVVTEVLCICVIHID